jgi:pyridoxine 5-phosphate synthase
MPVRLHVNIDQVASVRNARGTRHPDPVLAAQLCEAAGADGITAHLCEDRRYVVDDDIARLKDSIQTVLNLELAPTDDMLAVASRVRPAMVTLMLERREERSTEGWLELRGEAATALRKAVSLAKRRGIKTSLFIRPDPGDVEAAHAMGVDQVELDTGPYAGEAHSSAGLRELARLGEASQRAGELGLDVAAGRGLTRHNLVPLVAIDGIVEIHIGHAVVADALLVGLERAVRDFRQAIERGARLRRRS